MRIFARSLIGPLLAGTGIWCAMGQVSLVGPAATGSRLIAAAPLWWALPILLVALCLPGWRRVPWTATPALLAVLPWLPVAGPSAWLLWTGRLAWVPVAIAALAGLRVRIGADHDRDAAPDAPVSRPFAAPFTAAALTLALLLATAWILSPRLPGGDEPHYLVITQSLLQDRDLRIENNHQARDYAPYFSGTLRPDFLRRGRGEVIYSIHAPGLSALVLPLFALFGYRGAQATMILLAAVTGGLVWLAGWRATHQRRAAWFAWAAIAGSATFLIQGVTIFPDGAAAAIVALAAVILLQLERRERVSMTPLVGLSAALAYLPFLHTRFVTLAVGLAAPVIWSVLRDPARDARERARRALAFAAIPAVGLIAWLAYFQILYGTPNPTIPYGASPDTHLAYVPGGIAGLLFDQQFGLLSFAPVLLAAAFGWAGRSRAAAQLPGRSALPAVGLYLAAVGTYWMWWAGVPATPARFAAAILPLLAAPAAVAWARAGRAGCLAWACALTATWATSAVLLGVDRGALAWNSYDAHAAWLTWMGSIVDLPRAWPSFFWRLTPGVAVSEWPFAVHLAGWIAAGVIVGVGVTRYVRRPTTPAATVIVAAWAIALAPMLAAETGWRLSGSHPLSPATSQLRVLARAARGGGLRVIGAHRPVPAAASELDPLLPSLSIEVPRWELPGDVSASFAPLVDVPAGDYVLVVRERRPQPDTLAVRIGRSADAYRRVTFTGQSEQRIALPLPAGAASLSFDPDGPLSAAVRDVVLVPTDLAPASPALASASLSIGDATVFFLDDEVFVEPDGFWVRGGRAAALVIVASDAARALTLRFSNGPVPNIVGVTGAASATMSLGPGESRPLAVTGSARWGSRVMVRSGSGFRPSDHGAGDDARVLGVRVTIDR